ncbi:hypothetical protein SETIT_2G016100v2 [Setaria italica]|uniref:Uncharacterized protein n=1 Tax=Setaria italica TaxID=4555 RepID=A0A368PV22_SETIT|nr:hypothetical protein SETIT_2G016100v2 [Setaria italica]RCV09299.1 hypothetical protein SETIT_2G016100v2 [Setaria italica]
MDPAAALWAMDELVEHILLRCPADDPARLVRAALVCKRWCRILAGAGFRRRFRELHGSPPMLGFLHRSFPFPPRDGAQCGFASTTSFRATNADLGGRHALDSRHGRVLIGRLPKVGDHSDSRLAVWDPITGEQLELPEPPPCRGRPLLNWNAAVLCASSQDGACDHLDCHRGHFLVVVVGTNILVHFAIVYSSEDGAWSKPTYAFQPDDTIVHLEESEPSILAGNALYFISANETDLRSRILKYDLGTSMFDTIRLPPSTSRYRKSVMLTATENGGLGCGIVEHSRLCLWSRVAGRPNEHWVWAQTRVIELEKIIPDDDILMSYHLAGYAHGLDVLFIMRFDGLFSVDLKSGRMKRVCRREGIYGVVPYMSFCTPDDKQERTHTKRVITLHSGYLLCLCLGMYIP